VIVNLTEVHVNVGLPLVIPARLATVGSDVLRSFLRRARGTLEAPGQVGTEADEAGVRAA
jgi:hypothetical protein